jgi:hypothetical protein
MVHQEQIINKFTINKTIIKEITLFPLSIHLYGTAGAVRIASILYSSINLCLNTSICNNPKKPHLNPFPSVALLYLVKVTAGSVNTNFYKLNNFNNYKLLFL